MFQCSHLNFNAAAPPEKGHSSLPKRNYGFEKRQKELSKQRQKEEKKLRKLERTRTLTEDSPVEKAPSADAQLKE